MPFQKATTSLLAIEDRLRRAYGLPGVIGSELDPKLTVSVNAGDLYAPGLSIYKGRRFVWARQWGGTVATGLAFGLRFDETCEITQLYTSVAQTAGQDWYWRLTPTPDPASTFAAGNNATWAEQFFGEGSPAGPPIAEAGFATGAAFGQTVDVMPSGLDRRHDVELYIPRGSYLYLQTVGVTSAANPWILVKGRIAVV